SDTRWPHKPEIPTLKECGYGKNGGDSWFGIVAPAGTPAPIVTRMSQAIDEALKALDVLDKLDKGGHKATYLDPAAMRAKIDAESRYFADLIKRADVKRSEERRV